ncbi:MAG TPA: ABC-F family ATP-binding cassette domain-containing protein [Stenotrophomonas sp.]|nr:ABC-F family ATP-binding cassette domain-containing protein [Stenotrophomonas sp.]
MSDVRIRVSELSFHWPDGTPVLDRLSFALGRSRTGLVAPNGAGKSTLLKLLAGELTPTAGQVEMHGHVAYLPQHLVFDAQASVAQALGIAEQLRALDAILGGHGDDAAFERLDGDWNLRERATAMLARVGLQALALERPLSSLSGGEAMWLALAGKLLQRPDVLLLDEPSNHLDRDARGRLQALLAEWPGCLLVASHDRDLLAGMTQIAELQRSSLTLYGGGWDFYREAASAEQAAAEQRVKQLRSEVRRQRRDRQQAHERAERRAGNAARGLADAGLPRIVAGNRARSAQVAAGKAGEVHAQRLDQARTQLSAATQALDETAAIAFDLPATRVANDRVLFHGQDLQVRQGGRELFAAPGVSLTIRGPERIALEGPNGAGKTTLLQLLAGERDAQAGVLRRAPVRVAWLRQHLDLLDPARTVAENLAAFAPSMPALERAQLLARLQFRGTRQALPAGALSGGERLRATLACILHAEPAPQLLLLDEPTNNLDLGAIAQLEEALRAYQGALVVVSHDRRFLDSVELDRRLVLSGGRLREGR